MRIQIEGNNNRAWMRAVVEAIAVIARKTLICPTLFTKYTPKRHPIVNPRK
tara:strand:- start:33 stop:185 length:153 start_codon:yes stop_codon:yes gene_type:complete